MIASFLALVLAATFHVESGGDLAQALSRTRPGDVVDLAPGVYTSSLGRLQGVRVVGAGEGRTEVRAPEGMDGATLAGESSIEALTLSAPAEHCALVISGGENRLRDLSLVGSACGVRILGGSLEASEVSLSGRRALVISGGRAEFTSGSARGELAGVFVMGGSLALRRFSVVGPSKEAAVLAGGGSLALEAVVVRSPGSIGLSVSRGARALANRLTIVGGGSDEEIPGACVLSERGELTIHDAQLARCAGVAVAATGGRATLTGVDAVGASSGCFEFRGRARATLVGNTCIGRGPGLVVADGADVSASMNVWAVDPVRVVDCKSGARLRIGPGERGPSPCSDPKAIERSSPLDKRPPP